MPPEKLDTMTGVLLPAAWPPTRMPSPRAEILPLLLIPPAKVETAVPKPDLLPTRMPAAPAEMVPLLLMPPEKVEMTADAFWDAWPPTKMPLALAEIVALLRMPPAKSPA
jgi:hypothetical protein